MFAAPAQYYSPLIQLQQFYPAQQQMMYGQNLNALNLASQNDESIESDSYFQISKSMYRTEKAKINQEFKLRNQWIKENSENPMTDEELLKEWRARATSSLDNSDISPEARAATKQYLKEQSELHEALDQDDAQNEADEYSQDQKEDRRSHIIECWQKVDELEQGLYDTYLHAEDGISGQTLFKQAQKHVKQQKAECTKLDKSSKAKKSRRMSRKTRKTIRRTRRN